MEKDTPKTEDNKEKKDEKETPINNDKKATELSKVKEEAKTEIKQPDLKLRFNKIVTNYNRIHKFLNDEEKKNLLLISKDSAKSILNVIKTLNDEQLKESENVLNTFKTKHKEEEYTAEITPFTLNKTAMKVLEKLNEENNYQKIFISEEIPKEDLIFIYRLFLQLISKDNKKNNQNDTDFWKSAKDIIFTNRKGKLGDHLKEMIKETNFSDDNILIINEMCKGKDDKLTPKYYNTLCATTALIFLLIKDIFDYCGLFASKKTCLPLQYKRLEYVVKKNKEKGEKIKTMIDEINK